MKPVSIYIILFLLCTTPCYAQQRDFGAAGLKGLTAAQLARLTNGEIVILDPDTDKTADKSTLIEAAFVFSAPPDSTWKLISKTDDQPLYIEDCKDIKVIRTAPGKAYEVHSVGNFLVTYTYGVIQNYLPLSKCIYWMLDTNYPKNDLIALNGYWQFYPYSSGKTIARYGSDISFKNIPGFLESMFKKGGVKDALASVKKYVESGGTYRK